MTTGCGPEAGEDCHKRIIFYNNYDRDVYINSDVLYPDTMYIIKYPPGTVSQAHIYKTQSGKSNVYALTGPRRGCLEDWYNEYDTVMYFVLDAYMWENESSQTIIDNYLVLQRYDLSWEDIRQLEWSLPFPPTDTMKYMRMYPPYGTYNK
jgi:hypothetical protein